jgi:hypothetical protein
MDESFSPTVFLYGMALVLAVGKAFTLTIWRTLPKRLRCINLVRVTRSG